ncbi:MAG: sirohydrochlorin cobaltochelatase [Desulfuromonadales bacterium]|nr:sirohydrochlorin cobaltochelatase [Desulfuromonadales bacterium]
MDKPATAIVIAAFGTTHSDTLESLLGIVRDTAALYPQTPVRLAFTSNIIRRRWHQRANDKTYREEHPDIPDMIYQVKNILGTLADLQNQGYKTIVVQPTLLTPGEEFSDLQSYINGLLSIVTVKSRWQPFDKIALGRPLMGSPGHNQSVRQDLQHLAEALADDVEQAHKLRATLLYIGHGNEHLSNTVYSDLQRVMTDMYPEVTTVVGLVEGLPSPEQVLARLQEAKAERVLLKPLMVVAGDHAKNDMAGDADDSWKSRLRAAGITTELLLEGLGNKVAIRRLFLSHLRDAAAEAGIELR